MKKINFTCLFAFVFTVSFAQEQDLKLPFTIQHEFSIHAHGLSTLRFDKELPDTSAIAKRFSNLTNLRMGSEAIYLEATPSIWDRSFRNTFRYILGTNKNGKEQLTIDKNNNGDFSDDPVFVPDTIDESSKISASLKNSSKVSVEYDWTEGNKKVKQFVDVHIVYNPQHKLYLYAFAQHATAMLNGKKIEIVPTGDLSYTSFTVFDDADSTSRGISVNKYLKDDNKVYRIKDIDINEHVLILEKGKRPFSETESAQTGFRAPAFSAVDLISKDSISLKKYRGKYVFLDLWTTWCVSCLEGMPKIKNVYDKTDHTKIEFIGIVGNDNPERINKIINRIGINWKLVEDDSKNFIFNKYKPNHFPTTLLIDPNGIVIKSDLEIKELEEFIKNIH
jgi:thiol-disulfide isomerase/thioredoxin